jgi:hypothetical protein
LTQGIISQGEAHEAGGEDGKDATKVRLLTGAGLIDAKVVQVDAANDLALLKSDGKFSSLPISSSRSAQLGGTWRRWVFPTSVCSETEFNAKAQSRQVRKVKTVFLCALAPLRLCVEFPGGGADAGVLNGPLTPAISPPRGEGEDAAAALVLVCRFFNNHETPELHENKKQVHSVSAFVCLVYFVVKIFSNAFDQGGNHVAVIRHWLHQGGMLVIPIPALIRASSRCISATADCN